MAGKSQYYRNAIVFEMFPVHTKFSNSSGLKDVFKKHRFRDGLVWTLGLTVERKLHFQIRLGECGRRLSCVPLSYKNSFDWSKKLVTAAQTNQNEDRVIVIGQCKVSKTRVLFCQQTTFFSFKCFERCYRLSGVLVG